MDGGTEKQVDKKEKISRDQRIQRTRKRPNLDSVTEAEERKIFKEDIFHSI